MKHLWNIGGFALIYIGGYSLGIVEYLLVTAGAFCLIVYGASI
jgi:hypothetical protein